MTKPTIIVYGNCQSDTISACLTKISKVSDCYDIVGIPSFVHPIDGQARIEPADLERCALLVEQRALWHRFPALDRLPPGCPTLSFPMLALNAQWPLQAREKRNRAEPDFPFGRYPYGDRLLNQMLARNLSGSVILERYLSTPLNSVIDPLRLAAIEAERITALDALCDIPFGGWILSNFRHRCLFWTYNHPTAALLLPLALTVVERAAALLGLPQAVVDEVPSLFANGWEPADWLKVAIHPDVANVLELDWFRPDRLYSHYQHRNIDYIEYWRHQINFD
ncbi:WcbI family polysaccharide biosynthesis putative acetyltransferase [Azospirillum sp. 11R-A]|uniref:WcbI family polysaccharide biosynthesis putative acetyltransferase n=1 Tax=Azospirillum sp. 11R-A TaxID=3111634 RepID=UPI003C162171